MDVIIHGKPLDASECFSPGINKELARKIIGEFFSMGSIKESEALIVDARYWEGTWNSVYTLLLSQKVKDTAGRGSYFAISLIIPQKYCCIISEVYKLLENVVLENVLGVYLNKNLQYIVTNFEDSAAFDKLCSKLKTSYRNLEKSFDNSFKPQASLNDDIYCSLYDCDSLSVVQLLKNKGRVIITENTETKDSLATQSLKYYQMAQQSQGEIQQKTKKISELEAQLLQMENASKQASTTAGGKVKTLERKISDLEANAKQLESDKQHVETELSNLKGIIAQAAQFIEVPQPSPKNPKVGKKDSSKDNTPKDSINISRYLPLINTLLLFILLFGMFTSFKGCTGVISEGDRTFVDSLNTAIKEKDKVIEILQNEKSELQTEYEQCFNDLKKFQDAFDQMQRLSNPRPAASLKQASTKKQQQQQKVENKSPHPNAGEATPSNQ